MDECSELIFPNCLECEEQLIPTVKRISIVPVLHELIGFSCLNENCGKYKMLQAAPDLFERIDR